MPLRRWLLPALLSLLPVFGAPATPSIQLKLRQRATASALQLEFKRLDVGVEVAGNLAATTLSLEVANPNPWVAEGELTLTLGEDQHVAGFALDLAGRMREASVVDRARAEATYTKIVSRQQDPALLDQAGTNVYRIRIYPIPGLGSRKVRVDLEQALRPLPDGALLTLPLQLDVPAHEASLAIRVLGALTAPQLRATPLANLAFSAQGAAWVARAEGKELRFEGGLGLHLQADPAEASVQVAQDRGRTYAFAHVRLPSMDEAKPAPRRLVVAWDCSLAGQARDKAREWAVLEDYLQGLPEADVEVWAFNRTVFERRAFPKAGRDLEPLQTYLMELPADGTCDLGTLDFTASGAQEVLLCSPGLTRLFKGEPQTGTVPVQVLISSPKADLSRMRGLARSTGGEAFDLTTRSRQEVRRLLRRLPFQFLRAEVLEGQVEELYPSGPRPVRAGLGLACVLASPRARLRLTFGRSGRPELTREVTFTASPGPLSPMPRRQWAVARLEELEDRQPETRTELAALAIEHGLVTRDTSLLVLETLAQYVANGIPIPEDLREPGQPLPHLARAAAAPEMATDLPDFSEDLASWQAGRARWWSQPFRLGAKRVKDEGFFPEPTPRERWGEGGPPPPPAMPAAPDAEEVWCVGAYGLPALGYPGGVPGGDEDVAFRPGQRRSDLVREVKELAKGDESMRYADAGVPGGEVTGGMAVSGGRSGAPQEPVPATSASLLPGPVSKAEAMPADNPELSTEWPEPMDEAPIRTPRHWRQGADPARRLAKAPQQERWALYLQDKKKYCQSPNFFLDCARIFARSGQQALALGIASNLAEPPRQKPRRLDDDASPEAEPAEDGLEAREAPVSSFRLQALGELLWELGDLDGAALAFGRALTSDAPQRPLRLRQARLALARKRPAEALAVLEQAAQALAGEAAFDPMQGVAWEELEALRVRLGTSPQDQPKAWGLRIEVEGLFGWLSTSGVSVVDPRGERVWHEIPLGTEGLGLDDAAEGSLAIFMVRKPAPGAYRVELNPARFGESDHRPDEVRVRVTYGYGTAHPRTREFRQRVDHSALRLVLATFKGQ